MGFFIDQHQGFKGNVQDLVDLATKCCRFLNLPGDVEKINERTVRYYVTEGLVDKPLRIGRDAEYSYRHLLQFLVSRYLVNGGYPMAKVAPFIDAKRIDELELFLSNPVKPNLAELLVASFAKRGNQTRQEAMRASQISSYSRNIQDPNDLLEFNDRKARRQQMMEQDHRCQEEIENLRSDMRRMHADFMSMMRDLQDQYQKDRERWQKSFDEITALVKQQNSK